MANPTPEETLRAFAERHQPHVDGGGDCRGCGKKWPCPDAAAAEAVGEVLAALARPLDKEHTTSCGHTWTMRHTACPACFAELRAHLAAVVEAAGRLFTSIETIERQAAVLARRVQDDRPVDTILFECRRVRAALALAQAKGEK